MRNAKIVWYMERSEYEGLVNIKEATNKLLEKSMSPNMRKLFEDSLKETEDKITESKINERTRI